MKYAVFFFFSELLEGSKQTMTEIDRANGAQNMQNTIFWWQNHQLHRSVQRSDGVY